MIRGGGIELNKEAWYYNSDGELCHHGVKGQKWGVKNGPPYPLKRNNKPNESSGLLEVALPVAILAWDAFVIGKCIKNLRDAAKTPKQLRADKLKDIDKLIKKRDIQTLDDAPKLDKPMSSEESMKVTNPGSTKVKGRSNNCVCCTTAMVMRKKGYDVQAIANPFKSGFYTDDYVPRAFKNAEVKKPAGKGNGILDELSKEGKNAYGYLGIAFPDYGGAHSIYWENSGGKTRVYDGQDGIELTDIFTKNYGIGENTKNGERIYVYEYTNVSKCEPTEYALAMVERRKE